MSDKDLQLAPHTGHNSLGHWWWYEEPGGIGIHSERLIQGFPSNSNRVAFIPWRSIRAALKRKDKPGSR